MAIAARREVTDRTSDTHLLNLVARIVGIVAASVMTIIGLIAVAKIDWDPAGFDAPAVNVADMSFGPWIAIGTVVLGLLALVAAVSWDRESKLFMGAVLAAIGIAIVIANPTVDDVTLTDRMGWFALIVGAVLAAVGVIAGQSWVSRREVRDDRTLT